MGVPQNLVLSESATRSRTRVQMTIVALMLAFSVMTYFDRTIMSIAGPGIIKEFGLSETEMGSVYSAFILSYALLMIPGGWLVDGLGPWRVMTGMGFGAALLTALTALGGKPGLGALLGSGSLISHNSAGSRNLHGADLPFLRTHNFQLVRSDKAGADLGHSRSGRRSGQRHLADFVRLDDRALRLAVLLLPIGLGYGCASRPLALLRARPPARAPGTPPAFPGPD